MESFPTAQVPGEFTQWRRFVAGLVLRGLVTVIGYALAGFALFAFVTLVVELTFVEGGWIRALYPVYLLLGALAGANLGLATAIRREAALATAQSTGVLGLLVDRAVHEMALPREGIETERLRALAELEGVTPASGGTLTRAFTGFAMARAFEQAGVQALRRQMLRVVQDAEARGEAVVSQETVREAAGSGIAAAFTEQLDAVWHTNQRFTRVASALMLLSLPVLAILFG